MGNYIINSIQINKYENKKEEKRRLYNRFESKVQRKTKNKAGKKLSKYFSISLISFSLKTIVIGIIFIVLLTTANFSILEKNEIKNDENSQKITDFNKTKKNKILSNKEALEIGEKYMDICKKGILINNKTFIEDSNPIISVIIPTYNSEKTIKATIRSIQNQNMTNIEIISVNDFSTDNCIKIVEDMQKEDPRIKIIHNSKRMGVLYTRSIGALNAKGKYITTIDNDDFFANADLLFLLKGLQIWVLKVFKNFLIQSKKIKIILLFSSQNWEFMQLARMIHFSKIIF